MKCQRKRKRRRRGATVVFVAILMIPLLAMVAFCVDLGYCIRVNTELQNTADAAALAGASQLLSPQMAGAINNNGRSTSDAAKAIAEVKRFSVFNSAGGVNLSLLDADITIGSQSSGSVIPWSAGRAYPDSVQVVVRRDDSANGVVPLFFARAINNDTWSGQTTATASFSQGSHNVEGFNSYSGGPNAKLLPVAVAYDLWMAYMHTGLSADGEIHDDYKYVPESSSLKAPENVTEVADNIPEFTDVYPNSTASGNFGLLSIGPPATNTPTYRDWIKHGASPSDLAYFGPNGLLASITAPATVSGGTGLKSTLQSSFRKIIGEPRILPLYTSFSGNGSNSTYQIVAFAGVTIVKAEGRGSDLEIVVQPCIVIDPTTRSNSEITSTSSGVYPTSPLRLTK